MSGSRQRKERFGGRARAAVTVAAVALAVASLGTVALASSRAGDREGGTGSADLGLSLAAGRDGKLTLAGLSRRRHTRDFALARYTADGTLDRHFGTGGKVLTGFGGNAGANSLAIRPDGKIVVAGGASVSATTIHSGFAITRYTVAGKLDRAFGRNGKVLTYFGARRNASSVSAVAIQADGKIVAFGYSYDQLPFGRVRFALARYTLRGRLDRSFGRGGKVQTDFGARSSAYGDAVAIQPDGKIVAVGADFRGSRTDFALARYNADGTLDRSFGQGGRVVTKVGDGSSDPSALVVQPDGKLVAAGSAGGNFALVRYGADGKLDPSFGSGGTVVMDAGDVSALAIQRDRKLVAAGVKNPDEGFPKFALARFLEDGSLDGSFGDGGKLLTDFHRRAVANAVVVRPDGKLVVAGTVGGLDFALARYTSGGRLDDSFGRGGKVLTDFASVWAIRGR
jgi:uncharacterized delta-60 repeat protein